MRQLLVQVRGGAGADASELAREHGATTLSWWSARDGGGGAVDVLSIAVPNAAVGDLLTELERFGPIEATVPASGVFAFEPPSARPPQELVDVTPRSPIEILVAGQQSAGSWQGFLLYAVAAGVVVWIGLYTETVYLLTASMLLAPFAGPAMNTAIAITSGDRGLLRHSVLRYAAGVAVTAVTCGLLTLVVGQHRISDLTGEVLSVSTVAVLLPIAAGIAGANHLIQSEHSSLVSGAAVGMLVAASLAPPTGGLGIAVAVGRWDLVGPAAFLVALQLVGITLVASVLFHLFGLTSSRGRFEAAGRSLFRPAMVGIASVLVALVAVQVLTTASLQTTSLAQSTTEIASAVVERDGRVRLLEISATTTSENLPGPHRILVAAGVEVLPGATVDELPALEEELAVSIREAVAARLADVAAAVDVTAYPAPTPVS